MSTTDVLCAVCGKPVSADEPRVSSWEPKGENSHVQELVVRHIGCVESGDE